MKPSEHFHAYLEYCEYAQLIGPGEFIEMEDRRRGCNLLAWTRLVVDLKDTYGAGMLLRTRAENGSVAYVRKERDRLIMGMFDKDKQFAPDGRLDELFPPGEVGSREGPELILWAVEERGDFPTDIGVAQMTWLTVSAIMTPDEKKTVGTLAKPIAEKAAEAEPSDFPAVVQVLKVSTEMQPATVLQWRGAYDAKTGKVSTKV